MSTRIILDSHNSRNWHSCPTVYINRHYYIIGILMVSQHYIRHNIQYGYLQHPFWAFLWPTRTCNSKCILVIKHLLVSMQLMCHYYNMHLTVEHNGWFTNHHLLIHYPTVYILGFALRQPTSLCMYISIGQEFKCVMCAVCYTSMSGYAQTCAHSYLLTEYMCTLQVCNKLYVKNRWGLTAPSKYRVWFLIWQIKVSGQLQVPDVHEKFLNSANTQDIFCHHTAHHRSGIVTANALWPHKVQNA